MICVPTILSKHILQIIAYKYSDIVFNDTETDYINDVLVVRGDIDTYKDDSKKGKDGFQATKSCEYHLRIATDADYEFYQKCGWSVPSTYNYIFSILNIAGGVYESTFNMVFVITSQNVYATANQPYTSTSSHTLLTNQFRNHWNNNRTNVARNIAHLFTGKSINNCAGMAYIGSIDDIQFKYSF